MKWHQLIDALVMRDGGYLPVAKAMGKASFQGTLYKIGKGQVSEPSRASADRIAKHFKIDIDALYSDRAARLEAERLGLLEDDGVLARFSREDIPMDRAVVYELSDLSKIALPGDGYITVIASDDLPPDIPRGHDVTVSLSDREPEDAAVMLARKAGGAYVLGTCQVVADGFELHTPKGVVLDSKRHLLELLGTAVETKKLLGKRRL